MGGGVERGLNEGRGGKKGKSCIARSSYGGYGLLWMGLGTWLDGEDGGVERGLNEREGK